MVRPFGWSEIYIFLDFFKCCSDTFGRPPDGFAWLKSCPKCFVLVFGSGWSSFLVICENFFLTAFICYVHVWANLRFWSDAGNSGRWHCSMMGLFTSYSTTSEVMRVTVEDGIVQWWGYLRQNLTTSKVSRVTVEAVSIQLGQILDFSDLPSAAFGRPPDDFGWLKNCLKTLCLMFRRL